MNDDKTVNAFLNGCAIGMLGMLILLIGLGAIASDKYDKLFNDIEDKARHSCVNLGLKGIQQEDEQNEFVVTLECQ